VIGASGAPRASAFGSNVGDVLLPYPWATATVALPTANPRTAAEILLNAINSCFTDFSSNLPVLMDLCRSIGRSLDSNLNLQPRIWLWLFNTIFQLRRSEYDMMVDRMRQNASRADVAGDRRGIYRCSYIGSNSMTVLGAPACALRAFQCSQFCSNTLGSASAAMPSVRRCGALTNRSDKEIRDPARAGAVQQAVTEYHRPKQSCGAARGRAAGMRSPPLTFCRAASTSSDRTSV